MGGLDVDHHPVSKGDITSMVQARPTHCGALMPRWGFLMEKGRPHEWDHPPRCEWTPLPTPRLVPAALVAPTGGGGMSNFFFPTSTPRASRLAVRC